MADRVGTFEGLVESLSRGKAATQHVAAVRHVASRPPTVAEVASLQREIAAAQALSVKLKADRERREAIAMGQAAYDSTIVREQAAQARRARLLGK